MDGGKSEGLGSFSLSFTNLLKFQKVSLKQLLLLLQNHYKQNGLICNIENFNSSTFFYPLKTAIVENFLPDLFGSPITVTESELFCQSARHAGIGIPDPVKTAQSQFFKSKVATAHLIDAITICSPLDLQKYEHTVRNAGRRKEEEEQKDRDESIGLINTFPAKTQRCIMRKFDFKCSCESR